MRIVDTINDDLLKISILDWQEKLIVQCEDKGIMVTFKYDKSEYSLSQIKSHLSLDKILQIKNHIIDMHSIRGGSAPKKEPPKFEEII